MAAKTCGAAVSTLTSIASSQQSNQLPQLPNRSHSPSPVKLRNEDDSTRIRIQNVTAETTNGTAVTCHKSHHGNSQVNTNTPPTVANDANETNIEMHPDPKDPRFEGYRWIGNGYVHDVHNFDVFSEEPSSPSDEPRQFFECNTPETPMKKTNQRDQLLSQLGSPSSPKIDAELPEREPNATKSQNEKNSAIMFIGIDPSTEENKSFDLMKNVTPESQFPASPDEIWTHSKQIKPGAMCTVAWTFNKQGALNISIGKVTRTHSKRGGFGKLSISYRGVVGHKVGEQFSGVLPPQEDVRIYKLAWHQAPPAIDTTVQRDAFLEEFC